MTHPNPVEIIKKKRDGKRLSKKELQYFISSAAKGEIPDYQVAAFLMATFFKGMSSQETAEFTEAMIDSGKRIQFPKSSQGKYVDKHSTGGIGDKVSLILAPLVASLGIKVPMVAGRGLGHTGGTLDKLESMKSFRVGLTIQEFQHQISNLGVAIMGQTSEFVPADKLLYSLRDVTATVESVPLITASILSKKVAEGISGLVLDLKVGTGAFMQTLAQAQTLAKSLVNTGRSLGIQVKTVITDMNQPLGFAIGNALEVQECIDVLACKPSRYTGKAPEDLIQLTLTLASHMIVLAGHSKSLVVAEKLANEALQSGRAYQYFKNLCSAQGAKSTEVEIAPFQMKVLAPRSGFISKIDGRSLGETIIELGGGRRAASDKIDHAVGLVVPVKLGDKVRKGDVIATIFAQTSNQAENVSLLVSKSFTLTSKKTSHGPLIKKVF